MKKLSLFATMLLLAFFKATSFETTEAPAPTQEIGQNDSREELITTAYEQAVSSNLDVRLFLDIPGVVSEPVVSTEDDQNRYLFKNLQGEDDPYGTLLMGAYSRSTLVSNDNSGYGNTLIYGHNTDNGSKFANLHRFLTDEAIENSPVITVYDDEDFRYYKIAFVIEVIDGEEFILQKEFETMNEAVDYNKTLRERAFAQNNNLSINNKGILFLQTCKHLEYSDERYVFACVEIGKNE